MADFPGVAERLFGNEAGAHILMLSCEGPVEVQDAEAVHRDIATLRQALGDASLEAAFIAAPTPGQIAFNNPNRYYPSHREYMEAVGAAMRHEYKAITDAGLLLQLDSPDLAMSHHFRSAGTDIEDWRAHLEGAIDVMNGALEGIPPERVRLHVCWGNYGGPHNHDVPLADIIEPVLAVERRRDLRRGRQSAPRARVGALRGRQASRRQGARRRRDRRHDPPHRAPAPGRRSASSATRACSAASSVIAGTDCGFGTFVGYGIDPGVAWAKLESLVEGAQLASDELW